MTARTATQPHGKRTNRGSAAARKAARRRAAKRRAAKARALKITLVVLGAAALVFAVRQSSIPSNDADEVDPRAVQDIAAVPFPASDGTSVTLEQFRGAPLVLYFYEGQSCGACQTQLQEIQGSIGEFDRLGAQVLAVTTDPVGISTSVATQLGLSYPIVEDVDHALGSAMGTFEASGHMGPADQHSVVVLSADGTVAWRNLAGSSMYVSPGAIVAAVREA